MRVVAWMLLTSRIVPSGSVSRARIGLANSNGGMDAHAGYSKYKSRVGAARLHDLRRVDQRIDTRVNRVSLS